MKTSCSLEHCKSHMKLSPGFATQSVSGSAELPSFQGSKGRGGHGKGGKEVEDGKPGWKGEATVRKK